VIDYYRTKKEQVDIKSIVEPGISVDFAAQIDNKDTLNEILKYLEELRPIEKEIFILRIWDDMSYKHIAKVCGEKEDNCKKIFSRILKKIQANFVFLLLLILL
jgi:RNA polymerase sigma factor (sigma-70 family)